MRTSVSRNTEYVDNIEYNVPPRKELRAILINYLIKNSVRKMKSTTCLHFESPLRKGGVERAKLKLKTVFMIGNSI